MTNADKIEWLNRYKYNKLEIERLLNRIAGLQSLATQVTTAISGMPGGNGATDKIGKAVGEIIALQDELERTITQRGRLERQTQEAIASVDDERLRLLLSYRYIDGQSWEWIADKIYYSYDYTKRELHAAALAAVQIPPKTPAQI